MYKCTTNIFGLFIASFFSLLYINSFTLENISNYISNLYGSVPTQHLRTHTSCLGLKFRIIEMLRICIAHVYHSTNHRNKIKTIYFHFKDYTISCNIFLHQCTITREFYVKCNYTFSSIDLNMFIRSINLSFSFVLHYMTSSLILIFLSQSLSVFHFKHIAAKCIT
jgi:hypothetical protein